MYLRKEMKVHRMIKPLVLALSGCWMGDSLIVLLPEETNLTQKLKIYGPKIRCKKAAEGLTRRTKSRH